MDDLISRQAAIGAVKSYFMFSPLEGRQCAKAVERVPRADVVEVVRCKDCKHYVIHTLFGHRQGWCERLCDEFDKSLARGTEEDDFCSYAERRTDE